MSELAPPDKKPSILIGAVVYAVLSLGSAFLVSRGGMSMQYLAGCLGCLVILAGPAVAVWHYTSTYRVTMLAGPGAAMGAITGALGALIGGLASQGLILLNVLPDAAEAMGIQRDRMIAQGMDPAQVDQAMKMGESFSGLASNPVLGIAIGIVFGAALGALFGALATLVFKKGDARM